MKISPHWLREFVKVPVDDRQLADELTLIGIAVESISGEGAALTFEMEITTNRVDAMNHYGIARECAALYNLDLKPIEPKLPAASGACPVPVDVRTPEYCARFTGQAIRNVKIGSSQPHVRKRFDELEQKTINNAADATNFALLEMGKPTHAFDLDKLEGGRIVVRLAKPGETLKTLDGVERKLHPEDVVVADAVKPVALAGVIGGWETMITGTTKNIFIESAWWNPASVRRTARRHGIHTDASHRFERGADWGACALSCDRVSELILESAGGELAGEKIDVITRAVGNAPVPLRLSEALRILGQEVPAADVERILRHLGFGLTPSQTGEYSVAIPTWRLDIEREIDLIEEIARVYGFNKFANTLPAFAGGLVELPDAAQRAKARSSLLALGYNEAISTTFIPQTEARDFSAAVPVEIANPLSEEASAMRTSLVPGMLDMLTRNLNRGNNDVRLFEAGHVYAMQADGVNTRECASLCLGTTGNAVEAGVHQAGRAYNFFDLKGDIETLLEAFDYGSLTYTRNAGAYYHPGRSAHALMDGVTIARFGQIHPNTAAGRKLKQDVFLAEIELETLLERKLHAPRYQKLSRFPAVDRDFSFVFDSSAAFEGIAGAIHTLGIAELTRLTPVEVFRGGSVPAGKYSMLIRATFQSPERTLRDDEVAAWAAKIIAALTDLGGAHRA